MKKASIAITILILATAAVLLGLHFAKADNSPASQPSDEPKPVASVKTTPIRIGDISQTITAYGTVTAQPGGVAIISVPFESRVSHLPVIAGQIVQKNNVLIEIEPSPETQLQLIEARNALDAATKDLQQTQQRFDLKLATNQELQQSQQGLQTARVKLDNLTQHGAGEKDKPITADAPGIVSKIDVQEGQIVPAGAPLLELVPQDRIEVKLGVEPADADNLKPGQPAELTPINTPSPAPIHGEIRLIAQRLNPDTRLIDVFVSLPRHHQLLLDTSIRGDITNQTTRAMIVPRQAVLPDDDGLTLFTVKNGHAVKHTVKTGLRNDKEVEVIADGLTAGDPVVIQGNLELEDGMSVSTETPP
jgi:membrane fusion protein (multidrug efflux system)